MKRRSVLLGLTLSGAAVTAGLAGMTFRWHAEPQRTPFLTNSHLQSLVDMPRVPNQVLFIGNSFTLMHDIPARVAMAAARDGVTLPVAMAAAYGARLVDTWAINAFREALEPGWDILVMQDLSTTCLRAPDRWGSIWAMRAIAQKAMARQVLLYPTWAFPPKHGVYHGTGGRLARVPRSPAHFAKLITTHYDGIARVENWVRAPVTEAMTPDATSYLKNDIHHLNEEGADRVARVLWNSLSEMLDPPLHA